MNVKMSKIVPILHSYVTDICDQSVVVVVVEVAVAVVVVVVVETKVYLA